VDVDGLLAMPLASGQLRVAELNHASPPLEPIVSTVLGSTCVGKFCKVREAFGLRGFRVTDGQRPA